MLGFAPILDHLEMSPEGNRRVRVEYAAIATAGGTPPPVEVPMAMNDLPEPVPPQRE
jgi:hypothetical protein